MSLSNDGSAVAIGAFSNSENGFMSGRVRVYSFGLPEEPSHLPSDEPSPLPSDEPSVLPSNKPNVLTSNQRSSAVKTVGTNFIALFLVLATLSLV